MTEALAQEIECRQKALARKPIGALLTLRRILNLGEELQTKCLKISSDYQRVYYVPINLEIQAARIGHTAATISVVSSQYSEISEKIQKETQKFLDSGNLGAAIKENVQSCFFDVGNLILTREMINFFKEETKETPIDKTLEMTLLEKLGKVKLKKLSKV